MGKSISITELTSYESTGTQTTWTGGFGHWLKDKRTDLGYSQGKLARKAGLKKLSIVRYETRGDIPTVKSYLKLLNALGKEVERFDFIPTPTTKTLEDKINDY